MSFLKDTWDLYVFGHSGWLRFGQITQPWLRQAAKRWAIDDLPHRRGDSTGATVQCHIAYMAKLSESLRLQNAAQGLDIVTLGRDDVVQFANRLSYLESRKDLTARLRRETCRHVRRMLTRMRVLGLTRAGEPLEGLAPDFALREEDIPREAERGDEPGRALPWKSYAFSATPSRSWTRWRRATSASPSNSSSTPAAVPTRSASWPGTASARTRRAAGC